MSKEEILKLIKGRIEDEYRKHSTLDWSSIAASKIYSQWFEFLNNENKALLDKIEVLEMANKDTIDSYNIIVHELKEQLAESNKTINMFNRTNESLEKVNDKLQEQLAEKEKELSEVKEIAFTFYDAIDYTPIYIVELYDKIKTNPNN